MEQAAKGDLDTGDRGPGDAVRRTARLRWQHGCLAVLLVATAVLYLWHITVNGMGNAFYAAAAQSGAQDWKALLFGSLDARNFITVDKPPLSQWVMGLSGRLFGFSSASMLVPEALMAVGSVALTYAAVARLAGRGAGLLAGAALAVTPVAVLMFRFNNPDAVMVLMMTAAAYCTVRAFTTDGPTHGRGARWMALAGVALGLAFLAKMLEGLMLMPALAAAYLLAAPVTWRLRLRHLLGAALAFIGSAGWFVLLTALWPASSRPYLAGSTDNDFMNLVLGYNGVARLLGRQHDSPGPISGGGSALSDPRLMLSGFGNQSPGWMRLVVGEFGYEIGWLLPAALVATVVVLVLRGRAPRTDAVRAGVVLFGGWLVIDAAVLTFMHGMVHPYYCLSIAPPVVVMFALGTQQLWLRRSSARIRVLLAAMLFSTALCGWWILAGSPWLPWLRWTILGVGTVAAVVLVCVSATRRASVAALGVALAATLAGPTAYAVATVGTPHRGGGPVVGPARTGHASEWGADVDDPRLDAMLEGAGTPWSAAINRSSSAATLELATGTAVMAIGGFSGTDPTPSLQQFQDDVAHHRIGYYVTAQQIGHRAGAFGHAHADIAAWVASHFTPQRVGKNTVYDLSAPLPDEPAQQR